MEKEIFYTVLADYDLLDYNKNSVKSFKRLENANEHAVRLKGAFLIEHARKGLDMSESDILEVEHFQYYLVENGGNNVASISVIKSTFED